MQSVKSIDVASSGRKTFFISDHHFGHGNVIRLANRPFSSLAAMNDEMIARWNSVVGPEDKVFHLGDFALGSVGYVAGIRKRLNGVIVLIRGNHDGTRTRAARVFGDHMVFECIDEGQFVMAHRAIDAANVVDGLPNERVRIVLHGHSHGNTPKMLVRNGLVYVNLSVEHWNYTPVEYNQLMKEIADFESQIQEA